MRKGFAPIVFLVGGLVLSSLVLISAFVYTKQLDKTNNLAQRSSSSEVQQKLTAESNPLANFSCKPNQQRYSEEEFKKYSDNLRQARAKGLCPYPTPVPTPIYEHAELTNNYTKSYEFNDLGISSPLIEKKEVQYYTFRFRNKEVEVGIVSGDYWRVEVWQFEKPANEAIDLSNNYYATFLV